MTAFGRRVAMAEAQRLADLVRAAIATTSSTLGTDWQTNRDRRQFALIARLRAGATREQSQGELQVIADDLARAYLAPGRLHHIELNIPIERLIKCGRL
jgi:hypothetical protein